MLSTDLSDRVNALSWLVDTNKVEWTVDPQVLNVKSSENWAKLDPEAET